MSLFAVDTQPITEIRGDTWTWPIQFLGDDDVPIDFTGCDFTGTELVWPGLINNRIALTEASGRLIVDLATGTLTVVLSPADTLQLQKGKGAWLRLVCTDSLGRTNTLFVVPVTVIDVPL